MLDESFKHCLEARSKKNENFSYQKSSEWYVSGRIFEIIPEALVCLVLLFYDVI